MGLDTVRVEHRIGEEHRGGAGRIERRNPADEREIVSVFGEATSGDVGDAVNAAVGAQQGWSARPATERAAILDRAASQVEASSQEIAALLSTEEGKPLGDALNETLRTARNLRLFAGEALRVRGATFPADEPDVTVSSVVGPVGVIGVITPWNFPLSLASRKIAPALAVGNTVVWKPSPLTPALSDRFAQALVDAGIPPGVLNVVHGVTAGANLVADERITAVTFTGSTTTGRKIHANLGLGRRAQLELGGNNPVVVLADADLDRAADVVARSSFTNTGQACTGAGRILVDAVVHDELVDRVSAIASRYVLGRGTSPGTTMGPLVEKSAVEAMETVVAAAEQAGAKVVFGGARPADDDLQHGWFYPATLLVDVEPSMRIASEEVFGPVVGVERVSGLEEAIERANATEYGLAAAICTTSISAAQRFLADAQAGIVKVNRSTIGAAFAAPFGGIKQSGTGTYKEQLGPGVMEFYTQVRTVELGS